MANVLDHYQAVLRDLEIRQSRCQKELQELTQTITGIRKLISGTASLFMATPLSQTAEPVPDPARKYAGMSMRWAILNLMAEDVNEPMRAAEIAERLASAGVVSKGKVFLANVSAVISQMVKERSELEPFGDAQYRLTDNGRLAWAAIKHSPKYVNRVSSATVQ